MRQSCAPLETPIGRLWAVVTPRGLVAVERRDLPPDGAALDADACAAALGELDGYFAGRRARFTVPLDLSGASRFDTAIWRAAQRISYGGTASYGELALVAGHPGAARAAGGAIARCPLTPVVPCHRVIHADGSLGGWGGDTWVKRWLLDHERRHR